ncbi:hypothetical protein [Kitasatospora sp. NPDC088351]|uniref:hypothetical protein n=1 Tax=Kitasatospora sp. NPDC088351 TaxID=3155180 RepID=UPI00342B67AF
MGEEVAQRGAVVRFTRSAGQLPEQVSGGGRIGAGGVERAQGVAVLDRGTGGVLVAGAAQRGE